MGLRLTYTAANFQLQEYKDLVLGLNNQLKKNFEDMDFENSNRRNEMKKIIDDMERDCSTMMTELDQVYFEQ